MVAARSGPVRELELPRQLACARAPEDARPEDAIAFALEDPRCEHDAADVGEPAVRERVERLRVHGRVGLARATRLVQLHEALDTVLLDEEPAEGARDHVGLLGWKRPEAG